MKKKNVQQNKVSDGIDVEFSRELADQDDLEAQARADAADARQKQQQSNKK
ncbi:YfhD family protein [Bacillus sp. WLY-B-L8]|uniref:YfhD family protein n=1 Tax=Bacillus multifaciens TaxID=3068506 RepID=UPI00288CAA21|nr:YfhD family protein [Bacillus pseudomycoides]